MLGSNILDVAIGLIFVYLIFSLLVTVVNELIATYTKMRASDLKHAISRMLVTKDLGEKFYAHPLIRSLVKKDSADPSYIEPKTFARVVTDIIQANDEGKNAVLIEFAGEAQDDDEFRKKLEAWFNEAMDRVSGWYQRKIKLITLGIGVIVTILFNVNSIEIYKVLSTNNKVRGEVIVAAAGYLDSQGRLNVDEGSVTAEKQFKDLLCKQVDPTVNVLGIGWPHDGFWNNVDKINWWITPIGWILTVIAISLGSPFWFDLLSKAMKLRGTGTQVPTKSA